MAVTENLELLQGTLDVLILKTLSWGPRHGYAVARWLLDTSDDVLRVEEGALYPALHRLEARGWIESEWGLSDKGKRARFYELTAAGRQQLKSEIAAWQRYAQSVTRLLTATAQPA